MLSIKNVSKTYSNNKKAVDNLTLEIKKGEIIGFIFVIIHLNTFLHIL